MRLPKLLPFLLIQLISFNLLAEKCTYSTWVWDTHLKKAIDRKQIEKSKSELDKEELGSTPNCTVCEEDQMEVKIADLPTFKICKTVAEKLTKAIRAAGDSGFKLSSIVGYRVGKSKGPVSASGQRTQFSNHSYGTAIDFNSEANGLYDSCLQFGPSCRLLRGGEYRAESEGAITKTSAIYQSMLSVGFKWGGEIPGQQKDFMHFSLTGY